MTFISDTYSSIGAPSRGLYKELGSRFIAFAYPVESEEEVKAVIDSLRAQYHDARHCCYAYRLGQHGERFRANDDGEPSSSAGRPILGQIDSAGLSDVLIAVVRYFGGIKLGVPGLVRAYRTASADALANACKVEKTASKVWRISFDWSRMQEVMGAVKSMSLEVIERDFAQSCTMRVKVRLSLEERFREEMRNYSPEILGE